MKRAGARARPGLGAAGRGLETLNYSYEAPAPVVQEQSADAAVRRASRMGADLPAGLRDAFKAAERPATARRQAGKRENPTQCWLEQEVRERESLYVTIIKPLV